MMSTYHVDWRGYWPAAPTPFDRDGSLDESRFRQLLQLYLREGVHGVLVNGTTGEWFSQSVEERRRVAEIAVDEVSGRIPVVIGCSSFKLDETIGLGEHAREIGADGMLSTPPPYCVPTDSEVFAWYKDVSNAVELPLMVYNWPRGTNVDIGPDLAVKLTGIDRIVAIKDSTANISQATQTLEAVHDKVRVFGSFVSVDGLARLTEIGGDGSIDGGGIGAPFAVPFYEAVWRGDLEAARDYAIRYRALMDQLIQPDWSGVYGSPQAQLKAAMNLLGQPGGYPRRPYSEVDDPDALASLRTVLINSGLVPEQAAATA
jgi:1-pyrroline-4-hydroxy-2-carboxylate deaminase